MIRRQLFFNLWISGLILFSWNKLHLFKPYSFLLKYRLAYLSTNFKDPEQDGKHGVAGNV